MRSLLPTLASASMLTVAALLACPPLAYAQPARPPVTPPEPPEPPVSLADYEGHYFSVQIGIGAGVPLRGAPTVTHGVTSFLVNGEFDVDLGRYVQLGARASALLPGSKSSSGQPSSTVAGLVAQVRVFPVGIVALGILRPYVGFGAGYTFITTKSTCSKVGFGCIDETLFNGFVLAPSAGLRLDIPRADQVRTVIRRAARLISLYAEGSYNKSLWFTDTKPEVDRIVIMVGAGLSF